MDCEYESLLLCNVSWCWNWRCGGRCCSRCPAARRLFTTLPASAFMDPATPILAGAKVEAAFHGDILLVFHSLHSLLARCSGRGFDFWVDQLLSCVWRDGLFRIRLLRYLFPLFLCYFTTLLPCYLSLLCLRIYWNHRIQLTIVQFLLLWIKSHPHLRPVSTRLKLTLLDLHTRLYHTSLRLCSRKHSCYNFLQQ